MSIFDKLLFKTSKGKANVTAAAVIVAAGSSNRMGGENKLLCDLMGTPVIVHTLLSFEACPLIDEIVIVSRDEDIVEFSHLISEFEITKVSKVVKGGNSRTESVLSGLTEVRPGTRLVAIHDGARPLIMPELIEKAILCASEFSAAAPAVMLKDTIKEASGDVILRTVPRETLRAVQTPQVFDLDLIKAAISQSLREGRILTDDCQAVEYLNVPIHLIEGSYENIKITTPEDLSAAEAFLRAREE
ncbi:MAG: 2-C-methyl-D-erythritol 4-phosphate cytidylyltransferase [Clostridiales bacterium]|nr:2-C-methyl-D-erythritol 4-phosphate cytidylyltransferase [Clostridiales bacterium]